VKQSILFMFLAVALIGGCAPGIRPEDSGRPVAYENPNTHGKLSGIGIESADIAEMTSGMVSSMLKNPLLASRQKAPRIIVDSQFFKNQSSTRIDKDIITDQLRVELNRAANGRIIFIAREYHDMVAEERDMKRSGDLTKGSIGMAKAQAGADFRLVGRITSQDNLGAGSGIKSRFHQIIFELVDLETAGIIWNERYAFKKTGQEDVVYR
jgi:penicillin-binding protein activator